MASDSSTTADRVQWVESVPGISWRGLVDGREAYRIVVVGEPGPDQYPVEVARIGVATGARCTNLGRAMDLAEMNETQPADELEKWGLLLASS